MVEGICYRLEFHSNGWEEGEKTHISVGIFRTKLPCLALITDDKVLYIITMVHSSDRQKNFKKQNTYDWTGKNNMCIVHQKFYAIAGLARDEFIHADGSLHFEFKIMKQNFSVKNQLLMTEKELMQTQMERENENQAFKKAKHELHKRIEELGDLNTMLIKTLDKAKKKLEDFCVNKKITHADYTLDQLQKDDTEASVSNSPNYKQANFSQLKSSSSNPDV